MKEPLVSFVVPVYKTPPEILRNCLQSLKDVTLQATEIIVVFDGEPEDQELVTIAESLATKGKVISIDHAGACAARNAGTSMATGKYVVVWDADCYIKPDVPKRWIEEFDATGADFVYSGYELTNEQGGFPSEPFDAYSLQCGNFIASMFPIKREKAPKWDETLTSGQDWDFWLTAVENGCKGAFIEGSAFVTEPSGIDSISRQGLSGPNRNSVIDQFRQKHGIPDRPIGIFTMRYRDKSLKLAKILGADFIKQTGYEPSHYKTIFNLGYSFLSRFEGISKDVTKIQYWLAEEVEALMQAKYTTVIETKRIAEGVINLCGTAYEVNKLREIGIKAEAMQLPLAEEDVNDTLTTLPDDFSILLITDENYGKLLKEIEQDLPHVKFGYQFGNVKDYSCLMSFYSFAALDDPILKAHVNGRNVISNVQAPFCGFIDPSQDWDTFKGELYQKIREVRAKPLNREAKEYYLQLADPAKFKEKFMGLLTPVLLEVV